MQRAESDTPRASFQVARELWIYAVVTLPLTAITICACLWWNHNTKVRVEQSHIPQI
jgi:hypothetical protein